MFSKGSQRMPAFTNFMYEAGREGLPATAALAAAAVALPLQQPYSFWRLIPVCMPSGTFS
jgi:hypothetical protein